MTFNITQTKNKIDSKQFHILNIFVSKGEICPCCNREMEEDVSSVRTFKTLQYATSTKHLLEAMYMKNKLLNKPIT